VRTVFASVLAAAVTLSVVPHAHARGEEAPAAEDAELDAAMRHFTQGIALYEEGDYAAALFEFEKAYRTKPDYRLLFNIGVTALELKDYAVARDALQRYLADGGEEIGAERRAEVEQQLETLAKRVGEVTIVCSVEGASVTVDGVVVGTTPLEQPLVLNLGQHQVEITRDTYKPHRATLEVAGGSSTTLDIALAAETPPPVVEAPTTPAEPIPSSKARPLRIATYVGLGLSVAAGAGLAVAGTLALRADDDLQSELDQFPGDPGALRDARDRRNMLATTSDAMIGVTAGLAAITIGLGVATVVVQRRETNRTARVHIDRGLRLRF
jgi:hypothetical protein